MQPGLMEVTGSARRQLVDALPNQRRLLRLHIGRGGANPGPNHCGGRYARTSLSFKPKRYSICAFRIVVSARIDDPGVNSYRNIESRVHIRSISSLAETGLV